MQFETKIFVPVKNWGARIADLGGVLFFTSILLAALLRAMKYELGSAGSMLLILLWIASIIIVFVGRRMARGNMFEIGLSDTILIVGEDGIHIGSEVYPLGELEDLGFWIEGYDGMMGPQFKGNRNFRNRGKLSGADNKIHFRAAGKKHLYQFYLRNDVDMQQLGRMFEVYYAQGTPFRECNRGGPTFLFQQVRSRKQFEEMKKKAGYAG